MSVSLTKKIQVAVPESTQAFNHSFTVLIGQSFYSRPSAQADGGEEGSQVVGEMSGSSQDEDRVPVEPRCADWANVASPPKAETASYSFLYSQHLALSCL